MSEVTPIKLSEVKPLVNQNLIRLLEEKLEEAKRGDLLGIYTVCLWKGQLVDSGWSHPGAHMGIMKVLGEISVLQNDLIEKSRS